MPDNVVSAANGNLYVVANGFPAPHLVKVKPSGAVTTFAVGEGDSMQAGVAIDVFGRVYWSFPVAFECYHAPSRREALDG